MLIICVTVGTQDQSASLSGGAIAGIVIGATLLNVVVITLILIIYRLAQF